MYNISDLIVSIGTAAGVQNIGHQGEHFHTLKCYNGDASPHENFSTLKCHICRKIFNQKIKKFITKLVDKIIITNV